MTLVLLANAYLRHGHTQRLSCASVLPLAVFLEVSLQSISVGRRDGGCEVFQIERAGSGSLVRKLVLVTWLVSSENLQFGEDLGYLNWIAIETVTVLNFKTTRTLVEFENFKNALTGRFGQTTPPLVDFLKDILRRYPEGGQILKELIQNAEDAGATEVKFLYDETQYGTETLWSEDMAQYQGPALYVYNNAVFTPEDWHGIQEIARSRKKDDPLKVGRFGIGFNSVYHITDVPCIFSGDQIGMLDPHQTLFGPHESGQCWNLKDDSKEISKLSDQFAPFIGIFGSTKETFINGSFPGTFFRFPLRLQPSQLSSNLYDKQKVLELFESFRADADTVLLFLKSVQDVSLYVREASGTEKLVFRVSAREGGALGRERPDSVKILGGAISDYCEKIPSGSVTVVTYPVDIAVEDGSATGVQEASWLVCNSVGGRGISSKLDLLADELKFVPVIGIAMPLSSREDGEEGAVSGFSGKAFCFLPLPPGEESKTGLPVHVSGFFGLTDNRRSIKWRELDQWRDPAALWNELLVVSVVPGAYAALVLDAIRRLQGEPPRPAAVGGQRLRALARRGPGRPCTQLQLLNPDRFARLIKEVVNTFWPGRELIVQWYPFDEDKNHPPVSWLKMVWKNLYIHFSEDLTLFDEMPLIPRAALEEGQTCVDLVRLRIPSLVILEDESEAQLPEFLADIVQKLGGIVLKKLDASIQHPLIKKYIHSPSPSAVLQIMEKMPLQKLCNQIASLLPTHKDALREFLASLTDSSEKEKRIIQELTIFKRINHSSSQGVSSYTKLKGCRVLHHMAKLPADLRLSVSVIDSSDEATIRLANLLKVEKLKTTSCLKLILKDLENAFYSHEEMAHLMLWVLENLSSLKNENPNVLDWLIPLKFIQVSQERMVSADVLHSLRQIGLKNEASLKEKDVVQVAKKIEALQVSSCPNQDILLKKAKTLLQVLNKNHALLQSTEGKMTLKKIKWVPACKERPPNYPGSLVWRGDLCDLCAPPDMCDAAHAILVGSSLPLVESVHVNLEKSLGIFTEPSISAVLKHFKMVVDWYTSKTFSDEDYYQFQHILLEIYGFMHDHLNEGKDAFRALKFPWVWTGKKFCPLAQAVIKPFHDLDLQPYLHSVPKTMAKFHQLFKVCGSIEELTSDHISMVIQKIYLKSGQDLSDQESKQHLHLMLSIIRWLYSNQIPASPNTPVPVHHSKDPSKLIMKPIHECCYCDIKVDDLNDLLEDSVEPIILVHEDIPMKTAEWLKVPCLSTRLINPENMGFEQSGQREPLTVRIKNILEEYPSVSDIFKELLQNADDANATECSFMIDMRRNMDIRENLLDPGMAACHGPALWSFNNSEFSDSDFVNITSREFMIMFDPNINHIKAPYSYSGTLFRLSFRTQQEAKVSEVSSTCYNTADIYSLVDEFSLCGHRLIIFTQSVNSIVLKEAAKLMKTCGSSNKKLPTDAPKSSCILQITVEEFHHVFRRIADLQSPLFRGPDDDPATLFEMAKSGQSKKPSDELPQKTVECTTWLICTSVFLAEIQDQKKEVWKTDTKGRWNATFMRHVVVKAYLEALGVLRDLAASGELVGYTYYAVWPDPDSVHDDFSVICQGFYEDIAHGKGKELTRVFSDGSTWVSMKNDYLNPIILIKLVQLGMAKDDILWDDMLERAESVAEINKSDHGAACLRSSILLSLIDEKLKIRDPRAKDFAPKYQTIPFLPFLTKPAGFSLDWRGNSFKPETMFAATDLYTAEHQDIICLLQPILNENSHSFRGCGSVPLAVKEFLGLLRKPTVDLVVNQLKKVAKSVDDGITLYQETITNACYKYLHEAMMQSDIAKASIIEKLKTFSFILVENAYVDSEKVSFHLNFEAAPYLYQLPNKYKNNFRELFESVGVRQSFTVEDFALVLESIDQERETKQITEENFQLCRRIISEGIWSLIREKKQEFCEKNYGKILLPDTNLKLLPAKSLCYNDCPWIKVKDTTVKYCHADIPREVAVKLGAVPKRHKALERYASNICFTTLGTEFGQKEKLTSRIKSILNAYPSEKEMLKELLQNADDAKATEICFVFDPRQHPVDRIFDDKWAPLQGPALCVYNNQPFTEDDVRGIQNLGKGTKEGNPCKTGQYGIGFNSVYHITDCPSFISGNDILCIFDPHARYAPGATSVSPGRMFRDLDADFRTQFSDVLDLYLGTHFKLDNCTMFRFPLRNAEMAKVSEISSVPSSDRMVQNLLDKLRSDGAELLMFLNHMEKISICEIDKATGALNVLYSVKGKITDGDRLKRKQFHASVIDSVTKKRQLKDIPVQQITYTMDTEDSEGNLTTWLICNRSGFSAMEKVSKSVVSAHKNQDITLFPRGGVAACITHNYKKPHRAFCFLPLSLETGLPFHVNGHFALDSARRNLWRDDNGVGVRSDWNSSLMTALIAPAYVELLIQLKKRYFPGSDPTLSVLQNTPIHVVKDTLKKFLSFFPVNRLDLQPDLYCLVKALYSCIHEDMKRLLPVVRAPNIDGSDLHSAVIITWINMSTSNKMRPFFDNLLQDELQHLKNADYNITTRKTVAENVYRLKHLLLEIGFNLVYNCDETANLYHCLIDADIPVSYVTPADVRSFLMTFSSPDTNCHIGKLPCRLQQTNLKLFHSLKLLVDYCFKDAEENAIEVEGLPLLITLDSVLQTFDAKRPKFLTTYHELIPSRKDLFMNTLYLKYSNILLNCKVAKVFDISSFADLLSSVLPREYKTKNCTKWKDNFASESWLKNAWHFISESVNVKEDQEETQPTFDLVVDTLKDWALLPGTKFTVSANQLVVPEGDVLLPLSLMHIAVFPNAQSDKVFHALMKAGCIQLALNKICSKDSAFAPLLSCHTANIESPTSILKALHYMVQTSTFRTEKLVENDFEALLMYFNCNLNHLMSQDDIKILKSLPCYKSISGRYMSIAKFGTCYVLTKSIPSTEVEKWTQSSSSAFLEEKMHLKELYEVLGCVPVDDLEVYLKHLLPKIENLSYDAKLEHLIYLKNRLSSAEELSEIKEQLFEKLESLLIIYDANSRLKQAKHFYDRTVRVFEVMLPEKLFIPKDFFKKLEQLIKPKNQVAFMTSWVEFLRNIGLKHVLSQQQLLQFAKEVSVRANTENWSKETLQNTVDILLHHIFQERMDLLSGNFLKELSLIPFLCPERAPAEFIRFHPQYQEVNGTLPLIKFNGAQVNPKFKQCDVLQLLWTSCPILPEKATPLSIREQEGSELGPQEQLEQVLSLLNVNLDPPLDKVINNCRNICNITTLDEEMVKTRAKVLRSIYEFLSADKREFRFQLRGVAFVMVEDGWKLLKPEEVVINLEYESDFKPYLYKLPLELGTFHQLFKLLGTEDIISTKQYVEVLSRIFKNSEGKQLDPNEMRTVKRVVSGLFRSLQNDSVKVRGDLEGVRDLALYLPSQDGRLVKSSILVFDDAPHYKSRVQGNIGVQMLVDLSQCYLGKDHGFHTKLIMLFPQKLRPRLLSSILEEQLDEETPKVCQFGALCSLQGRLQLLLSSEQFITGLIRIMKHENDNAFLANEEKAIRLCKALREGLKVSCFEKLQTTLRVKGFNPIPHSRSETFAFLKRFGNAVILLYIQHSDSKDINFLLALAMTLKSATDNLISDTSYLIAMLGCNDIYRISEKLDSLGVKYDSSEPSKLELPMPGTPIPAEIHYTLLMDPMNVFYPGEYVGYLVDAEGGDIYGSYQPTYTYAIIVQEVEREDADNSSFLGKIYQIDIGYSEYKIVSSLDLYKFSRPEESSQSRDSAPSTPTSPTEFPAPGLRSIPPLFSGKEGHKTSSSKQHSPRKLKVNSLPEVLKEVTSVVEQAWKLPESERKKIIRRLYLKWHPDKNPENHDIANEVFKHLQNEINRLEKQAFLDQNADRASRRTFSTPASRFQSEKCSFQRFYTSWNQEATSHKSERQQQNKEQGPPPAGQTYSQRFFVPPTFKSVGNPVEARRWLRQARANFSAARNDLHKNANEWVCFKCYLSTKLALIAADYAVRGKSDKDVKPTALAQKIEEYSQQLEGLTNDVHTLEAYGVDSLKTRYPDLLPFPQIPNDRFTSEVAMRVMECTACIIIKLENFIQQKA
ncbi:sacsin [Camelus ferus]|nr:sacsin [Camelus ferus]